MSSVLSVDLLLNKGKIGKGTGSKRAQHGCAAAQPFKRMANWPVQLWQHRHNAGLQLLGRCMAVDGSGYSDVAMIQSGFSHP